MAEQDEAVWMHVGRVITIVELASYCGVEESALRELVEYGALEPVALSEPLAFNAEGAPRVRSALRLCNDFELESATVPLVLSLLERIHDLERRVNELSAQLAHPHH